MFCRSVGLLLQVSLPCALFAEGPSELCLKGGTNAEMAPQIDYTIKVFFFFLMQSCFCSRNCMFVYLRAVS